MKQKARLNKDSFKVLKRVFRLLYETNPKLLIITIVSIIISAIVTAIPSVFTQQVLAIVTNHLEAGTLDWSVASKEVWPVVRILIALYVISMILMIFYNQFMAIITQAFLNKIRKQLFNNMQDLPIRFFDTNKHGDIMSYYTNDVDTLRMLVSQTMPNLLRCGLIVTTLFFIMLYYSIWMTLLVVIGTVIIGFVSSTLGGHAHKYFKAQQESIGEVEGYVQEMMNGQKVIKVFNHEQKAMADFDVINDKWAENVTKANGYANSLGPIVMNVGNVLYVLSAIIGGFFLMIGIPNISLSGLPFTIDILVPYLNMTKQFTGNINQVSNELNHIVMAIAGAERVFKLMDETPEADEGKVTLVNVKEENGQLVETSQRTHRWAWKHPHDDGTTALVPLAGDVVMSNVDFSYVEGKKILHDINVYARPGQKVAFVGATGAGKTTITNLINRFYDIEEGTINYDGIDIKLIKKEDLRKSLGLVLQDTNLFTGTVMDNIRYGRLDASDQECIDAAKLVGADDFITRLPQGYETSLENNGANLSQGQRQLIAIARAVVADPPVLILDEATSSIDTYTESIVQRGMDKLMEGRTTFVIAHRLSTIKNSDVIMVLDHGRIIERGDHDSLLEEKGIYYQLYTGALEMD